jgi:hypothetical protein
LSEPPAADQWTAQTSDGRRWCEHDSALQTPDRSPWRELEALCQREGLAIQWAQVETPLSYQRLDAEGYALTCGELLVAATALAPPPVLWQFESAPDCEACPEPPPNPRPGGRYRWVRRDEPTRRVWGIVAAP